MPGNSVQVSFGLVVEIRSLVRISIDNCQFWCVFRVDTPLMDMEAAKVGSKLPQPVNALVNKVLLAENDQTTFSHPES